MPVLRRLRSLSCCLAVGLLVSLAGCQAVRSSRELPGTYVADYGSATAKLTLAADGRFTQEVMVPATGKRYRAEGTWTFDPREGSFGYLSLDGMLVVVTPTGQLAANLGQQPDGFSWLPVRRMLGRVEIGGDDIPWGREGAEIPYAGQVSQSTDLVLLLMQALLGILCAGVVTVSCIGALILHGIERTRHLASYLALVPLCTAVGATLGLCLVVVALHARNLPAWSAALLGLAAVLLGGAAGLVAAIRGIRMVRRRAAERGPRRTDASC